MLKEFLQQEYDDPKSQEIAEKVLKCCKRTIYEEKKICRLEIAGCKEQDDTKLNKIRLGVKPFYPEQTSSSYRLYNISNPGKSTYGVRIIEERELSYYHIEIVIPIDNSKLTANRPPDKLIVKIMKDNDIEPISTKNLKSIDQILEEDTHLEDTWHLFD